MAESDATQQAARPATRPGATRRERIRELRELTEQLDERIAEARAVQKQADRYWRDLHDSRKQAIHERRTLEAADPPKPAY